MQFVERGEDIEESDDEENDLEDLVGPISDDDDDGEQDDGDDETNADDENVGNKGA